MRTRALVAGITAVGCIGLSVVSPTADAATSWPGHPNRELVSYTVRPGDTLTGLAVRYHAWTAELAAVNHLRTTSELYIGEHLRIPVVLSAQRKATRTAAQRRAAAADARADRVQRAIAAVKARFAYKHAKAWRGHPDRILVPYVVRRGDTVYSIAVTYRAWTAELRGINHLSQVRAGEHIRIPIVVSVMRAAEAAQIKKAVKAALGTPRKSVRKHRPTQTTVQRMAAEGWRHWTMSRSQVRHLIIQEARTHHVSVPLALAIAWQESGWHQPLVSGAGAIGVMQLLPGTAEWMSIYAGRWLNPRNTYDNVLAGVLFLKYLSWLAGPRHMNQVIAGYYQGMTAIGKKPHWFSDTKQYVRSVTAIYERLV